MFRYIRKQDFLMYRKKTDGKSLYNKERPRAKSAVGSKFRERETCEVFMDTHGDVYSHRLSY